jgi:L-asparaginase II
MDHAVQRAILAAIAELLGFSESEIGLGIDGCSAPTFYLPLKSMARLFARLAAATKAAPTAENASPATMRSVVGDGKTLPRDTALARIGAAMMAHPEMVAGEGRLDTQIMRAASGRLIAKGGAEGIQCFGVLEGVINIPGAKAPFGVAMKIEDGDGKRGGNAAAVEALEQLGVIDRKGLSDLAEFHTQKIKNHRAIDVGEVRAEFQLKWMS